MREIEKAIKAIESRKGEHELFGDHYHFFDLAIQSLQEKAEREEGCEYCRERKPLLNEIGDLQIDDTDATLWLICKSSPDDIFEEHTDINYCPMCGRNFVGGK